MAVGRLEIFHCALLGSSLCAHVAVSTIVYVVLPHVAPLRSRPGTASVLSVDSILPWEGLLKENGGLGNNLYPLAVNSCLTFEVR